MSDEHTIGFAELDEFRACAIELCNALGLDPRLTADLRITINFEQEQIVKLQCTYTQFATPQRADNVVKTFSRLVKASEPTQGGDNASTDPSTQ